MDVHLIASPIISPNMCSTDFSVKSRVGSAKSAAFGRLSSEYLANLSESWNAFDDIVWIRVYPCVFASGFIRAINMDRSQSQLAKKY